MYVSKKIVFSTLNAYQSFLFFSFFSGFEARTQSTPIKTLVENLAKSLAELHLHSIPNKNANVVTKRNMTGTLNSRLNLMPKPKELGK